MPGLIGVGEFIKETTEDFNSPTTSSFVERMPQLKEAINVFEENLDHDRDGLTKLKKATKALINSGNSHVGNEICFVRALERLGNVSLSKEEPDIGAAFLKFSVVTKELTALMKTLVQSLNNIILFPVESILKSELKGPKGEMKRPFEKAAREYDAKYMKLEKEKKAQAKEVGLCRNEVGPAEIAEEMEKERKLFQLQMCEYLIKFNEIKTKKGIDLLQHFIEFYYAQQNYFKDGLKTISHFGNYIDDLNKSLQAIKIKQDEEKNKLMELRTLLKSTLSVERSEPSVAEKNIYSLHQLQGDQSYGYQRSGYLYKKSEGKVRRVWQKRKCEVTSDGFLHIYHADESKAPTKINLLTSSFRNTEYEHKRGFDVISYNRLYHFQTENAEEQRIWMSVLINCKEKQLNKTFEYSQSQMSSCLVELQRDMIKYIQSMPGNQRCCDCSSTKDVTWISLNLGILVCINCSGAHRDLGVNYTRIQSLTLDHLSSAQLLVATSIGNDQLNEVFEATLGIAKITPECSMEERYNFIREKYVSKRYVLRTSMNQNDLQSDLEQGIQNGDVLQVLQAWAEGADFNAPLPSSALGETALHLAVVKEGRHYLAIVEFLVQNMTKAALNKRTLETNDARSMCTSLHYCIMYDKKEYLKLLLRAGADQTIKNGVGLTCAELSVAYKNEEIKRLLQLAASGNNRLIFDNIDLAFSLSSHDDEFICTDFSDDDYVLDEKKNRSRAPSFQAGDSPIQVRSRSSTYESSFRFDNTLDTNKDSSLLDPGNQGRHTTGLSPNISYKRHQDFNVSSKSKSLGFGTFPLIRQQDRQSVEENQTGIYNTFQHNNKKKQGNASNDIVTKNDKQVLVKPVEKLPEKPDPKVKLKRCRALYDCVADNDDELEFSEGEIIIILNDKTDDENWMEGEVEGDSRRKGMFPTSFVEMLPD